MNSPVNVNNKGIGCIFCFDKPLFLFSHLLVRQFHLGEGRVKANVFPFAGI